MRKLVLIPALIGLLLLPSDLLAAGGGGGGGGGGDGGPGYEDFLTGLFPGFSDYDVEYGVKAIRALIEKPRLELIALKSDGEICAKFECGPYDESQVITLIEAALSEKDRLNAVRDRWVSYIAVAISAIAAATSIIALLYSIRAGRRQRSKATTDTASATPAPASCR